MSEEKIVYHKICKNSKCKHGFDFESTSRNAAYCCDECRDIARGICKAKAKKRAKKRKEYDVNKDINRALNKAYSLAHTMADDVYKISKVCACCGAEPKIVDGQQVNELHHKNLNPMDNSPSNLVYLCKGCHSKLHAKVKDVSMVDVYNQWKETGDISVFDQALQGIESFDKVIEEIKNS